MHLIDQWPLVIAGLVMVAAAITQSRWGTVPNLLTFSAILAGWAAAALISLGVGGPSGGGGIGPSFVGSLLALAITLPFYARFGLGAGCVKAHVAFGAWVGCALAFPGALLVTIVGSVAAVLLTAVGVALWMATRPQETLFPAQLTFSIGGLLAIGAAVLLDFS